MTTEITTLTHDPRWRGLAPTARRAAEIALTNHLSSLRKQGSPKKGDTRFRWDKNISLTLVLSNNTEVRGLNHQFRAKNKPTNVLSFPDGEVVNGICQLGDIILAYETLAAEAAAQNKKLKHHLSHLVMHGVLHLLGYDHLTNATEKQMEAIEIAMLARIGIANPYESA